MGCSHHAARKTVIAALVTLMAIMAAASPVQADPVPVELQTLLSQEWSIFIALGSTDLPEIALNEQQWDETWENLGFTRVVASQIPLQTQPEVDFDTFFVVGTTSDTCGAPQPATAALDDRVLTVTVPSVGPEWGCPATGTIVNAAYAIRRDAVPPGEITVRLVITGLSEHAKTVTVRRPGIDGGELPRTGADPLAVTAVAVVMLMAGAATLIRTRRT
ncbi:MAG: hypothetical protein KY469_02180 [Actinobacteria bacterium]|nr:hypothetical protein [Actinomycetota bacterium]